MKKTAQDSFIGIISEINDRLDELKAYAEDHMGVDPDTLNWGHVSSAQQLLAKLTELTDQAYKRGEYAE